MILVIYDGDCALCHRTKRILETLDFTYLLRWTPYQSGNTFGIPLAALEQKMHIVVNGTEILSGFAAVRRILLCSPWLWLLITVLLATPTYTTRILAALILCFFLPPLQPLGEIAYAWVARNRRRIIPGSTCGIK